MRRQSVVRAVASSTAAVLLLSLSGCYLLPRAAPGASPRPTATERAADGPQVGDCWQTSYDDLALWASWEGEGPVDCDEPHQSYTFLAEDLEDAVETGWDRGGMSDELAIAASEQCRERLVDDLSWTPLSARVSLYFFVPTESEWDDGDRRIRCDIAAIEVGSDYYAPTIEDLADIDDVVDDLRVEAPAYQLCLVGDGMGPFEGSFADIIDCADEYYWRYGGRVEFESKLDDPYPLGDTLFDFAIDECPSLGIERGESVYPYTPNPESWEFGDRGVECWFSAVEVPSQTV